MEHFEKILRSEVQQFIAENIGADLPKLLLRKSPFAEVSIQELAQQIKGKQIAQKKFPFLLTQGTIFPPQLNLEQASSQDTAKFKAQGLSGKSFLDLTCGLGIDAYFLSKNFAEITLIEQNPDLAQIVKHNWQTLGRKATIINENLDHFLQEYRGESFDLIYLDPARRDGQNNKKFLLEDLSPNILEIQQQLFSISKRVMVKLSPLIDLKSLLNQVKFISEIEIIAVKNEVKEVVLHLIPNFEGKPLIKAHNLNSQEPTFSFFSEEESLNKAEYSDVLDYLYIPNNAVLKSGAFNLIANKFGLKKLHPNTHLYTSHFRVEHFTGRVLKAEEISPKTLKKGQIFNIISKNHPLSPEQIKQKYQLKNGGEQYLIFTQSLKGKVILIDS